MGRPPTLPQDPLRAPNGAYWSKSSDGILGPRQNTSKNSSKSQEINIGTFLQSLTPKAPLPVELEYRMCSGDCVL
eukprot:2253787-Karenia_brevis.AAC.1